MKLSDEHHAGLQFLLVRRVTTDRCRRGRRCAWPDSSNASRTPTATPSIRIAVSCTKIYNRLLVPLTAAGTAASAPREHRQTLHALDRHADDYITRARLKPAA